MDSSDAEDGGRDPASSASSNLSKRLKLSGAANRKRKDEETRNGGRAVTRSLSTHRTRVQLQVRALGRD